MAVLSVRMDDSVKKQFDEICTEFGMNASVAVNLFAKAVLRERRIPFEISATEDPFYSEANQARIRRTLESYAPEKRTFRTMKELETMADE